MINFSKAFLLVFLSSISIISFAGADDNDVILQVSGNIKNFNSKDNKSYNFTYKDLVALGDHTIISKNKSVTAPYKYTGPYFRDVMEKVGVQPGATTALLLASDDYIVRVPLDDFKKWNVVVAHSVNDVRMTSKTNGPLWNAYPTNDDAQLKNDTTYAKMVWNLIKIKIK